MIKAIIFDFDGVIVNSLDFHIKKIKEMFGIPITAEELRQIHYGNFFDNKNSKLEGVDWTKYRDFIYKSQAMQKADEDTKKVILNLAKRYMLFIASSGGTRNIESFLKNNKMGVFKEVLGLEFSGSKIEKFNYILDKYNLKNEECVFITDTLGDIVEANNAEIRTIAYTKGLHDKKTLMLGKPYKIADSFDEIEKEISAMG